MIFLIQKIVRKIIYTFVPELRPIILNQIELDWLKKRSLNNRIEEKTKLYPPYSIFESKIGRGTYIAPNSRISYTEIGKFCSIGPNFICGWGIHPTNGLSTSPYFYSTMKQNGFSIAEKDLIEERKPIKIGNDVFIGANVIILDGVTIGDGAIIGAGAVISKDIPDFAIAVGSPIQIKKYRFTEKQRKKLKSIAWWNLPEDKLKIVNHFFFDVDSFIKEIENKSPLLKNIK